MIIGVVEVNFHFTFVCKGNFHLLLQMNLSVMHVCHASYSYSTLVASTSHHIAMIIAYFRAAYKTCQCKVIGSVINAIMSAMCVYDTLLLSSPLLAIGMHGQQYTECMAVRINFVFTFCFLVLYSRFFDMYTVSMKLFDQIYLQKLFIYRCYTMCTHSSSDPLTLTRVAGVLDPLPAVYG